MIGNRPGRCILTATTSPVSLSTARYTCANDAAPAGSSAISLNTSLICTVCTEVVVQRVHVAAEVVLSTGSRADAL
jgi:hypothetical protein